MNKRTRKKWSEPFYEATRADKQELRGYMNDYCLFTGGTVRGKSFIELRHMFKEADMNIAYQADLLGVSLHDIYC